MACLDLLSGSLSLRVSTFGGLILGFWSEDARRRVPLLRPAADDTDPFCAACYPLVPFANRLGGNSFVFNGRRHDLLPNTTRDPLYLHGDGWLAVWTVDAQTAASITMSFAHQGARTPYVYRASQTFSLTQDGLHLTLSVENTGKEALPFGLGFHPFFPLTPATTLFAPARRFWSEAAGYLPGEAAEFPEGLDFREPSPLPQRWVNNGLEDWSGEAIITWPEWEKQLRLSADPLFRHAFLFVSDKSFDPHYQRDYFCFEPMSHLANGHNLPGLGGLTCLEPGEQLSGAIRLRVQDH